MAAAFNCRDFAAVCLNNVASVCSGKRQDRRREESLEEETLREIFLTTPDGYMNVNSFHKSAARTMETLSILIWKWANQTYAVIISLSFGG